MGITGLLLQSLERHAAAIDPRWGAGLEAIGAEAQLLESFS